MKRAAVDVSELTPEARKRLGVRVPRARGMSLNEVRTHAIRVLAVVADLTPSERRRVLRQAGRLNDV